MLNKFGVCAALGLLTLSTLASAADMRPLPPPVPVMPRGGFFIGLGGSYNTAKFDQELYAAGVSNVYSGSTLVAFGQAGGPANPFHDNQSIFAPEAQVGFFSPIGNSSWLWGAKFRYKYLGLTSTERLVDSPQTGTFTNTGAAPAATSFTGNVIIQQSQMRVDHELVFVRTRNGSRDRLHDFSLCPGPNRTKGTTSARPVAIRNDVLACGLSAIRFRDEEHCKNRSGAGHVSRPGCRPQPWRGASLGIFWASSTTNPSGSRRWSVRCPHRRPTGPEGSSPAGPPSVGSRWIRSKARVSRSPNLVPSVTNFTYPASRSLKGSPTTSR